MRFMLLLLAILIAAAATPCGARAAGWDDVLARARGQTVYWNAWGGSQQVNDYIAWAAERVQERFGVNVQQVKLADTADAVARVLAEKAAGRNEGGSVDLVWINGQNFASMKAKGLLYGPYDARLPNYALVDTVGKPTTTTDFTVPVDGMETPWSMAQFVLVHDTATLPDPPRSIPAILAWARAHPGRFTYPQPPDYLGLTFLKQALYELTADPARLQRPVEEADFAAVTAPLWHYLDQLQPLLWRDGRVFPGTGPDQRQLLDDGEVDIAVSFDPLEAATAIAAHQLPPTARVYTLEKGTIANTSFVAIPFNARAREGAMVVANFLLSPEAQAKKRDPRSMGVYTVLDLAKLTPAQRALFEQIPSSPAAPTEQELGKPLPEPHPSWMERIQTEWQHRYVRG